MNNIYIYIYTVYTVYIKDMYIACLKRHELKQRNNHFII